jgi:hypothetical protein
MSHPIKHSKLLSRLDVEIAANQNIPEADCKRAQRAAYLVRIGRFDEARQDLTALQARNSKKPNMTISIWSNLAEGLFSYFNDFGETQNDKIQRAYALSVAAANSETRAVSAAWLAQWAYNKLDIENTAKYLSEVFKLSESEYPAAQSRACLVVAQALHFAGRPDMAKPWYFRARQLALVEGDEATVGALMHNMAWLNMTILRRHTLFNDEHHLNTDTLALAGSTERFDEMTGDSSWKELKSILFAQIFSLLNQHQKAIDLYNNYLPNIATAQRMQATLLVDKAWCHAQLQQPDEATSCAEAAQPYLEKESNPDNLACAHARLSQLFSLLGDEEKHKLHAEQATQARTAFLLLQQKIMSQFGTMGEQIK